MMLRARALIAVLIFSFAYTAEAEVKKHLMSGPGPDQRVDEGSRVALVGSGRVETGRIVRFAWTQVKGPRVNIQRPNRSTTHFIAPRVKQTVRLVFRLTVTDTHGHQASESVTVTVVPKGQLKPPTPEPTSPTPERRKPANN